MKFEKNNRLKKSIKFLMILIFSFTYISIDAMAAMRQTNKQVIDIEDYKTQGYVNLNTNIEDLPLPNTLRVVVKESVANEEFSQQIPSAELLKEYHYVLQDKELSLEKQSERLIYTYQDEKGQLKGYRVYGISKSKSNDNEPSFWSCEVDGTIIGRIEDIATTWNCVEYDSSKADTYKFDISNIKGITFEKTIPSIQIIVGKEKENGNRDELTDPNDKSIYNLGGLNEGLEITASPRVGTPTTLNVTANTRIVITKTGAKRYYANTDVLIGSIDTSFNTAGYSVFTPTNSLMSYATKYDLIKVEEGVTTTLFLNGIQLENNGPTINKNPDNTFIYGGNCLNVTGADVTIVLKNNTYNYLVSNYGHGGGGGGAIVKNFVDNHHLVIQCEQAEENGHLCSDSVCGQLKAEGTATHSAAIGSVLGFGNVGFSNLNIKGGIIEAQGGVHAPGIGTMCGTAHLPNVGSPQFLTGEFCRDITISGGRVYAKGQEGCAGIGSGWAGPVKGIYIKDGAYVKAEGGLNSPGIGSGGVTGNKPEPISTGTYQGLGIYDVSDVIISGGNTVVEAYGSKVTNSATIKEVPGIGCGISWEGKTGKVTNVLATPEYNWLAVVRQGTDKDSSVYINGGKPSSSSIAILPNKYYTLVYFAQISKTASINGGDFKSIFFSNEVLKPGDKITYKIDCLSAIEDLDGSVVISDRIPAGLTLSTSNGDNTAGMIKKIVNNETEVSWENQGITLNNHEFFFTVTVDEFDSFNYINYHKMYYANVAYCKTVDGLTFSSNQVYLEGYSIDLTIDKNDFENVDATLGGAGFKVYRCTNSIASHIHGINCTWDVNKPYRNEAFTSTVDGKLKFSNLAISETYIIVESTSPIGYESMTSNDYIVISFKPISVSGVGMIFDIILNPVGDFLKFNLVYSSIRGIGNEAELQVKNLPKHTLSIKKEVKGDLGDKTKSFSFKVSLYDKSGIPIKNKSIPCTSASFVSGVSSPYYSSLYFDSSGVASVTLKHGQSISLTTAIPYNGSYTVSEIAVSGYSTSTSNASGSNITNDMTASFINTKNGIVPTGLDESDDIQMVLLELSMIVLMGYIFLLGWRKRYQS